MKRAITKLMNTFRLSDAEGLIKEAIDAVTKEDWISHAQELVEEEYCKEIAKNKVMQHIATNFRDENDESEMSDMDGEEDIDSCKPLLFLYYNGIVLCVCTQTFCQ
jgi:hypothetical protein